MKNPSIIIFSKDWLGPALLRSCHPLTQLISIDLKCLAALGDPPGYLQFQQLTTVSDMPDVFVGISQTIDTTANKVSADQLLKAKSKHPPGQLRKQLLTTSETKRRKLGRFGSLEPVLDIYVQRPLEHIQEAIRELLAYGFLARTKEGILFDPELVSQLLHRRLKSQAGRKGGEKSSVTEPGEHRPKRISTAKSTEAARRSPQADTQASASSKPQADTQASASPIPIPNLFDNPPGPPFERGGVLPVQSRSERRRQEKHANLARRIDEKLGKR